MARLRRPMTPSNGMVTEDGTPDELSAGVGITSDEEFDDGVEDTGVEALAVTPAGNTKELPPITFTTPYTVGEHALAEMHAGRKHLHARTSRHEAELAAGRKAIGNE